MNKKALYARGLCSGLSWILAVCVRIRRKSLHPVPTQPTEVGERWHGRKVTDVEASDKHPLAGRRAEGVQQVLPNAAAHPRLSKRSDLAHEGSGELQSSLPVRRVAAGALKKDSHHSRRTALARLSVASSGSAVMVEVKGAMAMWCCVVWCGAVSVLFASFRFVSCLVVSCRVVSCDVVWCGMVWFGVVWCGVVW